MKYFSNKSIGGSIMTFIKPKSYKIRVSLIIFTSLLLFSAVPYFLGPGLTTPEPMGAYLNGTFPPQSTATLEPYRIAYPNLTFFYPITYREIPTRNKVIVGQLNGVIFSFDRDENTAVKDVLLDLSNEVGMVSDGGFLGLTVHPDFDAPTNPKNYVYVYYATKNWNGEDLPGFGQYTIQSCLSEEYQGNFLILERFEIDPSTMSFIANSRTTLLKNRMYGTTHRGGGMDFGDDGFLYVTTGDQTSWQKAQDYTNNLDGGVLRIDVDKDPTKSHAPIRKKPNDAGYPDEISGTEYWIPNDNPFLSPGGSNFEEYWSVGLRNPHRLTKDSATGTFYIGEVGLNTHEEINILGKGKNYGWPLFEGNIPGPGCMPDLLNNMPHENPLVAFTPQEANSIIGGYVYRGSDVPELYGKYICADFGEGDEIWSVDTTTGDYELLGNFTPLDVISFGEASDGELFLLKGGFNTPLYKLKGAVASYDLFPQLLSETNIFTNLNTLETVPGIIPYDLVEPFWSDGALKRRWLAVPNDGTYNTEGEQIEYSENGDWRLPPGTVLIKHFDLRTDDNDPSIKRKIETRLSIVDEDGKYYFLTYNWNEQQTDATLQTVALDEPVDIATIGGGTRTQTWHFPSNTECITCHSTNDYGALGLRSRYLNTEYTYDATNITANQLVTLSHLGVIDETITDSDTPAILTGKSIYDSNATLDEKARSYLDLNCAYCHRPETGNRAAFDLRLFNSLEATNLLNAGILSPLGIPDEEIVYPGDASKSILYHRINSVDPAIMMPPLAKSIIDQDAADLIEDWINQLQAPVDDMNTPDDSINLALLPSARVEGSATEGRGNPEDILYDPRVDDYYLRTTHNEYGVAYQQNLGTIDINNAFEWKVSWPIAKKMNYITFGGCFPNQDQTNTNWRISYRLNDVWTTLEEGTGGWLDAGIFEWGGNLQAPITADAVRIQAYSDGVNDVVSIHYRGRGGISTVAGDDSGTTPKAALFMYLPAPTNCSIGSITAGAQSECNTSDSTFTQDITITYANAPSSGNLVVNNQTFPIETSPQTVTLIDLQSNGVSSDVEAYFTAEQDCSLLVQDVFTAPVNCNIGNPDNIPSASINLGLVGDATLSGSELDGRGTPLDILYDPLIGNYRTVTSYNEYGVDFLENLGTPTNPDDGFEWQVEWINAKYINYVTFGGVYDNQPQPNTMWRISYRKDGSWITLEEGQGGWIDSGIYEWGGSDQQPFVADALRVQFYSDGTNDLVSIHLRGRGGNSNSSPDDSATNPKATLIQYLPLDNTCGLNIGVDDFLYCNGSWKDGNVPSNTSDLKDVYIGNGTYIINEDENVKVNNLDVAIDADLIIKEGGSLTINGNLTNVGSIVLESTSTKYSSLIVNGTSSGTILYKRHVNAFNGVTGNDLISSPLKGEAFGNFATNNPNIFENPGNTEQKLFGPFNEITGAYEIYSTSVDANTNIVSGNGYRAARDSSEDGVYGTTFTFEGEVETANVDVAITQSGSSFDGWNLIGNPYTSYIDFDMFFQNNSSILDIGSYQAIYGYDGNANDGWTILNSATVGRLIAPGQAFFVKSKPGGGTVTFTPAMRTSGNTDDFILGRFSSSAHHGHLKLKADAGSIAYSTDFYFNDNATLGLDPGYDASFFNGNIPAFSIYSHLAENDNGIALAIQALESSAINYVTIPIGINASQGQNISIRIDESDLPPSIDIYLEDNYNNTFTLLNTGDYNFTADSDLNGIGRFYLRFEGDALNVSETPINAVKILSDFSNKSIVIKGQLDYKTDYKLYDINGRVVLNDSLNVAITKQTINVEHLSSGIYILELLNANNEKRLEKLIIK